ncbi:twin-arginine translocase TatA/TatE family subunit [Pseudomonas putida]
MGLFDWKHWLVLAVVVALLFGGKRLKSLGPDLGEMIKGFRRSVSSDEETQPRVATPTLMQGERPEAPGGNQGQ